MNIICKEYKLWAVFFEVFVEFNIFNEISPNNNGMANSFLQVAKLFSFKIQ